MAANCGKSRNKQDEDVHQSKQQCPASTMALQRIHAIIDELGNAPASKTGAVVPDLGEPSNEEEEEEASGKKPRSEQMQRALQTTAQLWMRGTQPWKVSRIYQGNSIIDLEKRFLETKCDGRSTLLRMLPWSKDALTCISIKGASTPGGAKSTNWTSNRMRSRGDFSNP
jgi:hypothetical protein